MNRRSRDIFRDHELLIEQLEKNYDRIESITDEIQSIAQDINEAVTNGREEITHQDDLEDEVLKEVIDSLRHRQPGGWVKDGDQ